MAENDESKNRKGRGPDRQPRKKADPDARKRRLKNLKSLQGKSEEELDAILARAEVEDPGKQSDLGSLYERLRANYDEGPEADDLVERYIKLSLELNQKLGEGVGEANASAINNLSLSLSRTLEDLQKYRVQVKQDELWQILASPAGALSQGQWMHRHSLELELADVECLTADGGEPVLPWDYHEWDGSDEPLRLRNQAGEVAEFPRMSDSEMRERIRKLRPRLAGDNDNQG